MTSSGSDNGKQHPADQTEWIPRLAAFLRKSPEANAVIWDDLHTEVSVATMGPADERVLRNCLQETLNTAMRPPPGDAPPGLRMRRLPEQTLLEKEHGCDEVANLWTWRKMPWPSAEEAAGVEPRESDDWRKLAAFAAACGVLGIIGFILHKAHIGPEWLAPVFFILSMVAGGWDAARDAIPAVFRGHVDIHFLMLAVAIGAGLIGAFEEGALLLFLFSTAGALEEFAFYRTRKEINALFRLAPKTATLIDPATGKERVTPIEEIRAGDHLLVRPGETFPVDAVVVDGESAADESALTGEAHPVDKRKGDEAASGTLNLWGAVTVRCRRPASLSSLQQIIDLIQRARTMRAQSQRLTDRFGPGYTLGVLVATVAMFFVWWLVFGVSPFYNITREDAVEYSAFYRAMTLLVVASPCALVLSIPSAILAAIAWGARNGILFRGGAAIEGLAGIEVVAMDKTGTLTTGDLRVVSVESFPPGREREVAEMAYTLEQRASHPIARAIVRYGEAEGLEAREIENFRSVTGRGVRAEVGNESCLLGRRDVLEHGPLAEWAKNLPHPPSGLSEVWFVHGGLLGRILLEDRIREESAEVLRRLTESGLRTVMLTGDREGAAKAAAEKIGLSEVRAGLTPEGKVEAVRALGAEGRKVAMVGDGINDAPCLAAADIGVAMGARGSDAALEQSDVVLMNDRIENFFEAFRLSQRARRVIRQNIVISLGTITIMVGAAIFGIVPITVGVIAHEGSTVLVCLNSMRLLRGKTLALKNRGASSAFRRAS